MCGFFSPHALLVGSGHVVIHKVSEALYYIESNRITLTWGQFLSDYVIDHHDLD